MKKYTLLEIAQGKAPRSENKVIVPVGDGFMAQLGFTAIRFSQSRATMQTPGIPDRKYYNAARNVTCWWEAKAEDGKQSQVQYGFQLLAEACGEVYLLGTEDVLVRWVEDRCPDARALSLWDATPDGDTRHATKYQPEQFRWKPPKRKA